MPSGLSTAEMMAIVGQTASEMSKRYPDMVHLLPPGEQPTLGPEDKGTMVLVTQEGNLIIPPNSTGVFAMNLLVTILDANNQRTTEQLREAGVNIP